MPKLSSAVTITQATGLTEELYLACQHLIPQLTHNNPPPTHQQLSLMLSSPATQLFIARDKESGDAIVGFAALVLYRVPTGLRGYIEDVVVNEKRRGKRIGEALMQACLERAAQEGAPQVMLTCNPDRVAANRMYQRMGFELRKTNVYRYSFTDLQPGQAED